MTKRKEEDVKKIKVSAELHSLQFLLKLAEEGEYIKVAYNDDHLVMTEQTIREMKGKFRSIAHGLRQILPANHWQVNP